MKKKRRIKVWPIVTLVVIVLFTLMIFCLKDIYKILKNNGQNEVNILSEIPAYGYTLNENDSEYFGKLFKELKGLLESSDHNEKEYANLVGKLFLVDFYSLNSAINKNDIGGTQFVWKDYQSDFTNKAKTSVYAYVENNIYGDRKQELPTVTEASIVSSKQQQIQFSDIKVDDEEGYVVTVELVYAKDLGYPNKIELMLVHNDQKLEIAQMKTVEE